MTLVIDASVALKWVLPEEGEDAAAALLGERLIAPEIWLSEAASALWRRHRAGEFDAEAALKRIIWLEAAPVRSRLISDHVEQALRLAVDLGRPVYDCLYLACALREGAQVVTADRRFAAAVAGRPGLADRVRLLG